MIRKALYVWAIAAICCPSLLATCQSRPAFCDSIPNALLGGLAAPYAPQVAPDGKVYCEGLLRNPIALQPPTVISLKQDQAAVSTFVQGNIATLNWCDDPANSIHVRLRSTTAPPFALDAEHPGRFEWRADLIARWQPEWKNLAALGSRNISLNGQSYDVLVPIRNGAGYSSVYTFTVQSKIPIHLTSALIEPLDSSLQPSLVNVSFSTGSSKGTWIATIPFSKMKNGIYRLTFEESVQEAGVTTEPIYLLHKACAVR